MKWLDKLVAVSSSAGERGSPEEMSSQKTAGRRKKTGQPPGNMTKEERLASLTLREREVFALLMEGLTMRRSAEELGVKFTTVNSHCRHIYRKLGVNSRAEFILRYGIGKDE